MLGIGADNTHHTPASHNFTVSAHALYAHSYFHWYVPLLQISGANSPLFGEPLVMVHPELTFYLGHKIKVYTNQYE